MHKRIRMKNPFYINGPIPEPYFCDRQQETARLVDYVQNQSDVLLTSPRRMGKTQLIRHFYAQPEIAGEYHTFYVDIYASTSLSEFVMLLSKEIFSCLAPKGKQMIDLFVRVLKSLYGSFGYDPVTGIPTFDLKLGDISRPETTLEEIFRFLEDADKPCIVTIDEFQQIGKYPEKNVEALLRTYIQKMSNCRFIFAGSDRHSLENMFNSPAKPFYNSVSHMYLDRINRAVYIDFAARLFNEGGIGIPEALCGYVYDLFEGHTYYVHQTFHDLFARHQEPTAKLLEDTIDHILSDREHYYMEQMSMLTLAQKETLTAVAREGDASRITSAAFIRKHSLQSASMVQNSVRFLLEKQILTYRQDKGVKIYSVADRFLRLWLVKMY